MRGVLLSVLMVAWSGWCRAQLVTMEVPEGPLDMKTHAIMNSAMAMESDVDSILSHAARTDANIAQIRMVQECRQKVVLALAQMRLLQDQGLVLMKVGPAAGVVAEAERMLTGSTDEPKELAIAAMPSLTSPMAIIDDFKALLDDAKSLYQQGVGFLTSLQNFQSVVSGLQSPWGILDVVDSGMRVLDGFDQLTGQTAGIVYKVDELVWTGRRFIGTDWTDVDSIMGLLGTTLDLERELPALVLPVSGRLARTLEDARAGYQQTMEMLQRGTSVYQEAGEVAGQIGGWFGASSESAVRQRRYAVADGIWLRRECRLDGAYAMLVQKGTGAGAMEFASALTDSHGIVYEPSVGYFPDGDRVSAADLNNSLSGGARGAVDRFLADRQLAIENPFASFARAVAPVVREKSLAVSAGQPLRLGAADVAAASGRHVDFSRFPSLSATASSLEDWAVALWTSCQLDWRRVGTGGSVVVIKPTASQSEEYGQRLAASDRMMRNNRRQTAVSLAMLNYSQAALEAASSLRAALDGIAGTLTALNAVEAVPMMVQNCDSLILYIQQLVAFYGSECGRLALEQHAILSARADSVRSSRENLERDASLRVAALVTNRWKRDASADQGF